MDSSNYSINGLFKQLFCQLYGATELQKIYGVREVQKAPKRGYSQQKVGKVRTKRL